MNVRDALHSLPDDELLRRLSDLLSRSRRVEADLVAHIAEVDARRLYAREATPSMFAYATQVLHLSEHEAFLRIGVARASREHPVLLEMLRDGRLHLSGIAKLAAHLTRENRDALLARAVHRSKRQIEELVAELTPQPEASATIRKLPERHPAPPQPPAVVGAPGHEEERRLRPRSNEMAFGAVEPRPPRTEADAAQLGPDRVVEAAPAPPAGRAKVTPVAPARYRVQFDASTELRDKLERLQALMRTSVPDGNHGGAGLRERAGGGPSTLARPLTSASRSVSLGAMRTASDVAKAPRRSRSLRATSVALGTTLAVVLVAQWAASQAPEPAQQARVPTSHANVHASPGSGSAILVLVPEGTVLPVIGRRGEWVQVRLSPELRKTGMVMRWYEGKREIDYRGQKQIIGDEDAGWMHDSTVEITEVER